MKSIHELEVTWCWHVHEKNWQWQPLNPKTFDKVRKCVRECTLAKWWLNANCAHTNNHPNNADEIFEAWLSRYKPIGKTALLERWKFLGQLNSRVDQLHRFGNGGNLDKISWDYDLLNERRADSEDLSLKEAVYLLSEDDPLKIILLCAGSMSQQNHYVDEYWELLKTAEEILVERKVFLLDWVKMKQYPRILLTPLYASV